MRRPRQFARAPAKFSGHRGNGDRGRTSEVEPNTWWTALRASTPTTSPPPR